MLVQNFLENSAERSPDKTALICGEKRLTYAQLDQMANRLANALLKLRVRRGDRVAIYLDNCFEAVAGAFGILKAGGVFVIVNRTTKADKLRYILTDCGAVALITDHRFRNTAQAEAGCLTPECVKTIISCGPEGPTSPGPLRVSFDEIQKTSAASQPEIKSIDLDLACLIYTSGTTGDPKGVMSDHSNVVFAAGSIIEYLENVESDVVLNVLPLSFDYGLYQVLMTFKFGGTLVLEKSFAFPAAVLKKAEQEKVTGFPGVPTIFALLLQMDLSHYNLSSLRYLTNTAAALPPSHIQELQKKFPGVTLHSMYGLTETKRTLHLPPHLLDSKPGSVGIAIPGTEVWIEDETGNKVAPGTVGELVVRGRHVMRGYWNAPEATAKRFRPGPSPNERVFYSGDLFRMDGDGCMYFISRKDDIIKSRGEKVAPKEVENVIYGLKGVLETMVVGVPDPIFGQAIKAVVVKSDPNLTESEILAHCRANLEDFMVPRLVEFRESLPKTSSGKITRKEEA